MNEMTERLAAKLKLANEEWARSAPMNDCFHMPSVYHYMAREALEEMIKPTSDMIAAGSLATDDGLLPSHSKTFGDPDKDGIVMVKVEYRQGIWRSMISAALYEQ